jgi:exonuclease III
MTYNCSKFSANLCLNIEIERTKHKSNFNNKHYGKLKFLFLITICGDVELNPGQQFEKVFDNECNIFKNTRGLKIIHFNAQSIIRKIDSFRHICDELRPDFLCISESWLKTCHSDYEFRINGYKLFRKDRDSTLGGGVAVYAKMDSNFKFYEIRDESSVEKVIINVSQKGTKDFIIASIYRPPDSELTIDLEINRILKKFSHKELIICGDFNINTMNSDHKNFKQIFRNNGFSQLIDKPTRIANNTMTYIDHIYTNKTTNIRKSGTLDINISDH